MNRQQRRAAEKQRRQNRLKKVQEQEFKEFEIELYFNVFAEQLHKEFGFGAKRLTKLWKLVDERIGEIADGKITKEEIEKELVNSSGVVCSYREDLA